MILFQILDSLRSAHWTVLGRVAVGGFLFLMGAMALGFGLALIWGWHLRRLLSKPINFSEEDSGRMCEALTKQREDLRVTIRHANRIQSLLVMLLVVYYVTLLLVG